MVKSRVFTAISLFLILSMLFLPLTSCKKKNTVLDGTYVYYLGDEIPTFSYVFENNGVTMYVGGEFQAQGTYYVENEKIYLNFEVSTKIGKYDEKNDEIIMMTSDYGEIVLSKVK